MFYDKLMDFLDCPLKQKNIQDSVKIKIRDHFESYSIEGILQKLMVMDITQSLLEKLNLVSPNGLYLAEIGEDGRIYVGSSQRKSALYTHPLYTVGKPEEKAYAPFSVLIKSNGQLLILNKDENRIWQPKLLRQDGVGPFKLELENSGELSY